MHPCPCTHIHRAFKFMTTTCRLGDLKSLALRLGKYDTDPFWHNPDMQSKSSYQKIPEVQEWKINVQNWDNFFLWYNLENWRLTHVYFLKNTMCYIKMFMLASFPQEFVLFHYPERRDLFDLLFKYVYIFILFI